MSACMGLCCSKEKGLIICRLNRGSTCTHNYVTDTTITVFGTQKEEKNVKYPKREKIPTYPCAVLI